MVAPKSIPPYLPRLAVLYDLPDEDVRDKAARAAASVRRLADLWERNGTDAAAVLRALRHIAKRHAVRMPDKAGVAERINRMCDAGWWRRALHYRFKAVELHQIQTGAVHSKASPYVSDKALRRHERHAARLVAQMAALEAVNQKTGEVIAMPDLIEASLSNPTHRRNALMARIKGIEASAKAKGHIGLFLTLTCPSRMHARLGKTGAPNETYDGTFPGRAHSYLRRVWSNALREAAHQDLTPYGLRVVEPHHDACPHWHVLAFVAADQADTLSAIVRRHALRDSPNEPGAQVRRFTVERIDPSKGSAVGYVAKYVSKSIDGEGVDKDNESDGTGQATARRQIAWARTWGIRQFQFFGVPPITPTRELYRVAGETLPGNALAELHAACKANDYAAWLAAVEAHGLRLSVDYSERPSTRYRGEVSKAIQGLRIEGGDVSGALQLTTRCDTWQIVPKATTAPAAAEGGSAGPTPEPPWTRFNNSAPVDFKDLFPGALPEGVEEWGEEEEEGRCPAPGTATRCRTRPLEISRGAA
ncbi:replication endonuclease [Roseateles sp.]|uniref:replication endonuclease n=1 Tax=Roseateles sp. TaxID=1971397 RepID=UPI0031DA8BEE